MKLSEVSIHRPVFATVLSLVVTLVGLVGYSRLSVREYPNIDAPVVTVTTSYPGASAAIVRRRSPRCSRIPSPASKTSTTSPR